LGLQAKNMSESEQATCVGTAAQRPWDARLACWLVTPLKNSGATPNQLTTLRLLIGLGAAAAFIPGTYGWSNLGALLLILSNFADHMDGELARISGKFSPIGHLYDLASDAAVTILLFIAIGVGIGSRHDGALRVSPVVLGTVSGTAIALIFFLRMRIEELAGKAATQQASLAGFETEDVLYLLPLVTLGNRVVPFLVVASICAPLFALWVVVDYRRALGRRQWTTCRPSTEAAQ
jgi:phosphatidylglycerophosphate synthase